MSVNISVSLDYLLCQGIKKDIMLSFSILAWQMSGFTVLKDIDNTIQSLIKC